MPFQDFGQGADDLGGGQFSQKAQLAQVHAQQEHAAGRAQSRCPQERAIAPQGDQQIQFRHLSPQALLVSGRSQPGCKPQPLHTLADGPRQGLRVRDAGMMQDTNPLDGQWAPLATRGIRESVIRESGVGVLIP